MKRLGLGSLVVAILGLVPISAGATTISATCSTCGTHDTSFNISYDETSSGSNIYTFVVTATYGSTADFVYLNDLAFKIDAFDSTDYENLTPTVATAPVDGSTWSVVPGGLNSTGCDGAGAGWWCVSSATLGATHIYGVGGDTDTWTFTLDLKDGVTDLAGLTSGGFKADFTDASGNKVGSLLSESIQIGECTSCGGSTGAVPEPSSILLLATGLVGAGARLRNRFIH